MLEQFHPVKGCGSDDVRPLRDEDAADDVVDAAPGRWRPGALAPRPRLDAHHCGHGRPLPASVLGCVTRVSHCRHSCPRGTLVRRKSHSVGLFPKAGGCEWHLKKVSGTCVPIVPVAGGGLICRTPIHTPSMLSESSNSACKHLLCLCFLL